LELVVVIGIIMALAGILTLTLPDLLTSANNASMVTNIKECDDMIQTWASTHHGQYPDGLSSLMGPGGTSLYSYLPSNSSGPVGGYLEPHSLTAAEATLLVRAGIKNVYHLTETFQGAMNPSYMSDNTTAVPVAAGVSIAFIKRTSTTTDDTTTYSYSLPGNKMQFDGTHVYAVLGIGRSSELVGVGGLIKDQPVIVHAEGCSSPKTAYCVPCAIFDLGSGTTGRGSIGAAKFVGCVALADSYFRFSEEFTTIY
jgi:hypothetical protein